MPVEVQFAASSPNLPSTEDFQHWAQCALSGEAGEVCIRIVEDDEAKALNSRFRGLQTPTNVLSFPVGASVPAEAGLLGDIVVCAPVVEAEARRQAKPAADHFAHMVVHGVLHLRGYNHVANAEAAAMERLEQTILNALGIADPYAP